MNQYEEKEETNEKITDTEETIEKDDDEAEILKFKNSLLSASGSDSGKSSKQRQGNSHKLIPNVTEDWIMSLKKRLNKIVASN